MPAGERQGIVGVGSGGEAAVAALLERAKRLLALFAARVGITRTVEADVRYSTLIIDVAQRLTVGVTPMKQFGVTSADHGGRERWRST